MVATLWKLELLGNVATLQRGFDLPHRLRGSGTVPIVTSSGIGDTHCEAKVKAPGVITGRYGTIGEVFFIRQDFWPLNTTLYVRDFHGNDPLFISYLLRTIDFHTHSGKSGVPGVNRNDLHEIVVSLPPTKVEQEAIAGALSDTDALIESLEQLINKKRQVKQGTMQELLTGKKRLPGFNGEWEVKTFGEIVQPRKERIDPRWTGPNEFCVELEHIEQGTGCLVGYTATSEISSLKSVFQKDDVLFGKLRAYLRKYWLANREGVCSTEIWVLNAKRSLLIPQFLFQLVKVDRFVEVASSAYGTHMPRSDWNVVKTYKLLLPLIDEQKAIAAILTDMDAEIAALEAKLDKVRQIKQGMMQELLTGRIRLI
jgi:type I restriction enzyme, S subunit